MNLNVLPIDDATKGRVREFAERSARPENWYYPYATPPRGCPVGDEARALVIGTNRVVFTWTVDQHGNVNRHMTISTLSGRYPPPEVALTIAAWLGFTGAEVNEVGVVEQPGDDWGLAIDPAGEKCIGIGQRIAEAEVCSRCADGPSGTSRGGHRGAP